MKRDASAAIARFGYAVTAKVLASLCGVSARRRTAFRGKLQHLRMLGVPKLPKSGRGVHAQFAIADIFEVLVALRLQQLGCPPKVAAKGAKVARKEFDKPVPAAAYLLFLPEEGFVAHEPAFLAHHLNQLPGCSVVNLALCERELLAEIAKIAT